MERHPSWGSILLLIYQLEAHDLKNGNAHLRERWKMLHVSSMNPNYVNATSRLWKVSTLPIYRHEPMLYSCSPCWVRNCNLQHESGRDDSVVTKCVRNNKYAMYNMCITAASKTLSLAQSTVSYWLEEVNRSIVCRLLRLKCGWLRLKFILLFNKCVIFYTQFNTNIFIHIAYKPNKTVLDTFQTINYKQRNTIVHFIYTI